MQTCHQISRLVQQRGRRSCIIIKKWQTARRLGSSHAKETTSSAVHRACNALSGGSTPTSEADIHHEKGSRLGDDWREAARLGSAREKTDGLALTVP